MAGTASSDFSVLKVRRNVAEVAYTMLKRQWLYPARAASVFDDHPWALVEGLVRAEAVLDALPGETVEYADAVLAHEPLEGALRRLYPDAPLAPLRYIDRGFARTRGRLEAERRDSLVFRRLEWIVAAVRERLRFDEPREEIAEGLPGSAPRVRLQVTHRRAARRSDDECREDRSTPR